MSAPAIRVSGLKKNFGASEIIRGVDLDIQRGERHAIIGPNGAGKSTLFHLISARLPVTAGAIELKGEITNIFHNLSVFENLRCAVLWSLGYRYSFWQRLSGLKDARQRAEAVMEEIGLSRRRDTPAGILSYAEQRALEIGITIASGADVILLDEPTAGMSNTETEEAVAMIRRVTEGKTLVMVEHDMGVVFGLADRISVLVYGQIIATDAPAAIRCNAAVQEAYLGTSLHSGIAS